MVLKKSNKYDVYAKETFYVDTKSLTYSLYDEGAEFRSFLSRDLSKKLVDGLDTLLENGNGSKNGKPKKRDGQNGSDMGALLKANGKLKKPVISFFADKARVLKEEIDKISADAEARKFVHCHAEDDIARDAKELSRLLQDILLYQPGTKHSIDLRRMDLERSLLGLRKELRTSSLSLWRDLVSLRRELREIIFEYQALKRMAELVENGGGVHGVSG